MSLYEFKRDPLAFSNSEPPGRGLDIKERPESVPLLGVGGGPLSD